MKQFLSITIIIVLLSSCQSNDFQSVDVDTFATIIADTSLIRLDVRTQVEYDGGHIPNALLIDAQQPNFVSLVKQHVTKEQTIALYCRSGRRSKQAAATLASEGYTVIELHTGFISWTEKGYSIED